MLSGALKLCVMLTRALFLASPARSLWSVQGPVVCYLGTITGFTFRIKQCGCY